MITSDDLCHYSYSYSYHFRKGSKILNKNGQNFSTKIEPFQTMVKNPQQNGTISENGKNFSTKWYHFRQKRLKIPQQKWYLFRKGSKILDKNGTI